MSDVRKYKGSTVKEDSLSRAKELAEICLVACSVVIFKILQVESQDCREGEEPCVDAHPHLLSV